MKQLLQNLRTGELMLEEVPVPSPGTGMVLVQTSASLISAGTERMLVSFAEKSLAGKARSRPDLVRQTIEKVKTDGLISTVQAVNRKIDQPISLGYSSAGVVVELGEGVTKVKKGQRVACAGGGYAVHAEYALVPENLIEPLPENVSDESAAFTTLAAIALHGYRLAQPQVGENVAVIGLGLLGLLTVMIAKSAGCYVFGIDLDPDRVGLAKEFGAKAVAREGAEESAAAFTAGKGFDSVLICADASSNDPINLAADIARDRATVVSVGAVGLNIPRAKYFQKELTLLVSRSYGPGRYDPSYEEEGNDYPIGYVRWTEGRNLEAVVSMMANEQLDVSKLITHRFPIDEASKAYELVTGKQNQPFLGVLLTYPSNHTEEYIQDKSVSLSKSTDPTSKSDAINLGVLGAGNFANAIMFPIIKDIAGVNLVGIASNTGLSAQQSAKKFGFAYASSDPESVINDPEINTIAVLTRHDLHAEQILASLRAGKHVFCEKPLALTKSSLHEIENQLNEDESPILMIGFNRRFAPMTIEMKAFFQSRSEPMIINYRVNAGYLPPEHWLHHPEQGGGRIIGEACHFVDFITYLVGQSPSSVVATGLAESDRYREDNVVMTHTFPDGSVGTISYLANGDKSIPKEKIEVYCQGRVAYLSNFRKLTLTKGGKSRTINSRFKQDKGHKNEWLAFQNAITSTGKPPIPHSELFSTTHATFSAIESLRNDMVVKFK